MPLLAIVFILGAVTGATGALAGAWYAMTPTFRQLVRASWMARRAARRA